MGMRLPRDVSGDACVCVATLLCAAFWLQKADQPAALAAVPPATVIAQRMTTSHADMPVGNRVVRTRAPRIARVASLRVAPDPPSDVAPSVVTPADGTSSERAAVAAAVDPTAPSRGSLDIQRVEICRSYDGRAFNVSDALQECIDRAPAFSTIELPPGKYELTRQVVITRPLTLRTAGSTGTSLSCVAEPDRCAILTAAPELIDTYGLLFIHSTNQVTLEHVVLDGNRAARLSSIAARFCLEGRATAGFNAAVLECVGCTLQDVVSRNALCGTGLVWSGAGALIQQSAFLANGDAATPRMWSDGLTLLYAPDSEVRWNQLWNNSDVALIIGYGVRSRIEENTIVQRTQSAFAGIMLHNFGSDELGVRGDFRDAVIADNSVDCGPQLCVFGIQVGPRPWDSTKNIVGGDLHQNRIRGAKVGINVDGAGTLWAPTRIFGNVVSEVPAGAYFAACADPIPADWMNVSPTSVVDRHAELSATGEHLSEQCQFSSGLAAAAVGQ